MIGELTSPPVHFVKPRIYIAELPEIMLSSSLLHLLALVVLPYLCHSFRHLPRTPSKIWITSRSPTTHLPAFREKIKAVEISELSELVTNTLRRVPSPLLVAVTALSSTLLLFEVSKFIVLAALPTVAVLMALTAAAFLGGWFVLTAAASMLLFSPLLMTAFAAINLSSIVTAGISYLIISFAVQTLMNPVAMPSTHPRESKFIDVEPILDEEDSSLEEIRRMQDFDRRLRDRL